MKRRAGLVKIGISGWTYAGWRGVFYPDKLPHKQELFYASRQFRTIEINGTHYGLQTPKSFRNWYEETPDDFVFSVKGSRYITHMKRLKEIEKPLANFFASGVLALREKLGPFLWQLPPSFKFEEESLDRFLSLLPQSTEQATELGRRHDDKLKARAWTRMGPEVAIRHCLEIRHDTFMTPAFFELLRRHKVAFVLADTAGKWPYTEDLTADFVYIRLHGDKKLYESGYSDEVLTHWASRIKAWRAGKQPRDAKLISSRSKGGKTAKDVFVYFDNDMKVKAPGDALRLRKMVGDD